MTPIYATSTYVQASPGVHQGFEYSRSHNPTRFAYERCVAELEGGTQRLRVRLAAWRRRRPCSTCSTAAATSSAMDDVYGGTYRLFERVRRRSAGLDFSFVDLTDLAAFEAAIKPNTQADLDRDADQSAAEDRRHRARSAEFARKRGMLAGGRQHLQLADPAAPARTRRATW